MTKTIYLVVYATKVEYLESSTMYFDTYEEAVKNLNENWNNLIQMTEEANDTIHDKFKEEDSYYMYSEDNSTWLNQFYEAHIETINIEV